MSFCWLKATRTNKIWIYEAGQLGEQTLLFGPRYDQVQRHPKQIEMRQRHQQGQNIKSE
jgi:hypothetical protein